MAANSSINELWPATRAFAFPDLLAVVAVLALIATIVVSLLAHATDGRQKARCVANLQQITPALLSYSEDNAGKLPDADPGLKGPVWWWYKEQVKAHLGLRGASSPSDKVFGCPADRGYHDGKPFRLSAKFDYGSYAFNGVNLSGMPNVAGRAVNSIKEPGRTLLLMEWTAHAPLSWHKSKTGSKNSPFYCDAKSVVAFVDGHVSFIPIYYDGYNAAYTQDPIAGYDYQYSAK